ncbi:uncharacterized protein [Zea mays]|uniref:HAT C-terminal dimerisation domain-containing protein n=1 Tax=Zea mays TaxID=4577 RepID=A0A804NN27_MAIZE|nr:uncharacterized protein LOC103635982 isoform X2 [Zea mays]XP_020407404.1 uncharacterized protein LOC103653090 [Zea mays]XP_020407474.1 uncharacterized protein LOC103653789 [Zea mays]XP_020407475.1 uncharacterized protein LOC103653789 [Zea mays]XP_020407476.1 uncharacterized protein LOC103653789 [Zea mays]XP_020407477.1 uncharacterized protein LOC103653789 [Zea mays]|eukprot:XP_008656566.1 uncharacterized protein LOC103635982 [Zea mays]
MERVSSAPEMDDVISTDQSSRSTKRRAKVWDYVDSELVDGKEKAICKYSGRILGKNRTSLSPETLEALVCAKDWLIGFNDEEEGEPMTGKRMFDSDDEEDDWEI